MKAKVIKETFEPAVAKAVPKDEAEDADNAPPAPSKPAAKKKDKSEEPIVNVPPPPATVLLNKDRTRPEEFDEV